MGMTQMWLVVIIAKSSVAFTEQISVERISVCIGTEKESSIEMVYLSKSWLLYLYPAS